VGDGETRIAQLAWAASVLAFVLDHLRRLPETRRRL
jgi:hypothetical protein